jgi:hypothetical protein
MITEGAAMNWRGIELQVGKLVSCFKLTHLPAPIAVFHARMKYDMGRQADLDVYGG